MKIIKKRTLFLLVVLSCITIAWKIASSSAPAAYPGGKDAMVKFLQDSLRYPEAERKNGKEAIVSVRFTISKTGEISDAKSTLVVGESENFKIEAERLVKSMPKWTPALDRRGRPIEDWEYASITFELPDSLAHLPPPSEDTTVYLEPVNVDSLPKFPGAPSAMQMFLAHTVRYPEMERERGQTGTVYVTYTIEKNGQVSNVVVARGVPDAPGLSKEAVRVVSAFPRHRPALKNGKAVRFRYTVPVRFMLQ